MPAFHRARVVLIVALLLSAPLFAHPGSGIVVDRQGQVYFMDTGGGVWKIDTQGRLSQQDPTRFHWMAIDLEGRFARGRMPASSSGDFSRTGVNPTMVLSSDFPVAIGKDGAFYYLHTANEDRRAWIPRVRRLRPDGTAVLVATIDRR